jgi:hypothetical protein
VIFLNNPNMKRLRLQAFGSGSASDSGDSGGDDSDDETTIDNEDNQCNSECSEEEGRTAVIPWRPPHVETEALKQVFTQAKALDRVERRLLIKHLNQHRRDETCAVVAQLPDEVWCCIFELSAHRHKYQIRRVVETSRGDLKPLFAMACVSRRYAAVVQRYVQGHFVGRLTTDNRVVLKFPELRTLAPEHGYDWALYGSTIAQLTSLTSLSLPQYVPRISDRDMWPLVSLTHLSLHKGNYLGNRAIENKLHLKTLSLWKDARITDKVFRRLNNLTSLGLHGNITITDAPLKTMWLLQELDLCRNKNITDDGIAHMVFLRKLSLKYNANITGRAFRKMSALTSLNLRGNDRITDSDLSSMTQLRELNLCRNEQITNDGLSHLTGLTALNLAYNDSISDRGVTRLTQLQYLWLCKYTEDAECRVSSAALYCMESRLKGLVLGAHSNIQTWVIQKLTALEELVMDCNPDIKPEFVAQLHSLRHLGLWGGQGFDPASSLHSLTALKTLNCFPYTQDGSALRAPPVAETVVKACQERGVLLSERQVELYKVVFKALTV